MASKDKPEEGTPEKKPAKAKAEPKAEKPPAKAAKAEKPEKAAASEKKPAAEKAAAKKPAAEKAPAKKAAAAAGGKKPPVKKAEAPAKSGKSLKEKADARAIAKYIRTAPRKMRLVADAIRGRNVQEARNILNFARKRAAHTLVKVLNSAVANAENNHELDPERLFVWRCWVDQGPAIKRFIPRARGRASGVKKYTSHVTIELKVREEGR